MSGNWTRLPLGDLLEGGRMSYGIVQPGPDTPGGVPIVRVTDLNRGRINTRRALHVAEEVSARHRRTVLQGGELLVSIVGTIGLTAVVPEDLAGWNVNRAIAVIRPVSGVSPAWIGLCLQTRESKAALDAGLNTTVQSTLNLSELKRIPIPMPPKAVREAIVTILDALDAKVALNERQNELIQELAAARFVRTSRCSSLVEARFVDVAEVGGGGTPSTSKAEYWGGAICWATPTDITALTAPYLSRTSRTITDAGLASCASALYRPGSILMTSRATIGAFAIAQVPTAVNQGFIVVNARDSVMQWWLYHDMQARVAEFLTFANGATFLELPRGTFKSLPVRIPEREIAESFAASVDALHRLAVGLARENAQLCMTRDALLPLLMSGKIPVRDAEKVVEGVA